MPLLIILGVGAIVLPVVVYPVELHGLAGRRPGDAPARAGRRRPAVPLSRASPDGPAALASPGRRVVVHQARSGPLRTSVRWLHSCHSPPTGGPDRTPIPL